MEQALVVYLQVQEFTILEWRVNLLKIMNATSGQRESPLWFIWTNQLGGGEETTKNKQQKSQNRRQQQEGKESHYKKKKAQSLWLISVA